ncbi:hypothetical protein D3C78_1747920 [compost metagenome]
MFEVHDVLRGCKAIREAMIRRALRALGASMRGWLAAFLLFLRLGALPAGIPLGGERNCSSRARKTCSMPVRCRRGPFV